MRTGDLQHTRRSHIEMVVVNIAAYSQRPPLSSRHRNRRLRYEMTGQFRVFNEVYWTGTRIRRSRRSRGSRWCRGGCWYRGSRRRWRRRDCGRGCDGWCGRDCGGRRDCRRGCDCGRGRDGWCYRDCGRRRECRRKCRSFHILHISPTPNFAVIARA